MGFEIEPAVAAQLMPSDEQKAREKAEQEKAKAAEAAKVQSGKFVQYLGPQTVKGSVSRPSGHSGGHIGAFRASITAAQWQSEGIASESDHDWHVGNDWRLPVSQFSKEQLDHLLTPGKDAPTVRFKLVDGKGNSVSR